MDDETRAQIIEHIESGWNNSEIAALLSVKRDSVENVRRGYNRRWEKPYANLIAEVNKCIDQPGAILETPRENLFKRIIRKIFGKSK